MHRSILHGAALIRDLTMGSRGCGAP